MRFSKSRHHLPLAERFARFFVRGGPEECWLWLGSIDQKGYGRFAMGGGRDWRAHRVAYQIVHGAVPDGLHVLHSCDNPACVNPRHLSADTNHVNREQAWERDRHWTVRKITPADLVEIKKSALPHSVLAEQYGLHQSEISRLRSGRRGIGIQRIATLHQEAT